MAKMRMKSSLYLSEDLHERVKALGRATSLPFNTHVVLALEEYLQEERRAELIRQEIIPLKHDGKKPSSF